LRAFLPKPLGHQDFHRLPQHLFSPVSERFLCLRIDENNPAFSINGHHGIGGRFEQAPEFGIRQSHRFGVPFLPGQQFTVRALPEEEPDARTSKGNPNRCNGKF